ncbi:organic hydroperoxide resistance protein [Bordetella bronchialis]|uniref:Peroxiredoxin n=1 Tax=Bordetella bronchialis TaxID=463025 RepID=A0A193FJ76_9BORD|nr:organic hydroperoxide resistance protein [Bordetella bronchialis]ANN67288.1 peroxiredoxin [Bordetella bronchialis]ANN72377.1 peroxiredoxin [Bordetella bronchialis]
MSHSLETVLYTAHTRTTGGREGAGRSSDGALDVKLGTPGTGQPGTNPEQLFAVGWSACFIGAMQLASRKLGIRLPDDTAVDASVSLGKTAGGAHYALAARLTVTLPGLDEAAKRQLVEEAHQTCPYSRATRGNIDVELRVA